MRWMFVDVDEDGKQMAVVEIGWAGREIGGVIGPLFRPTKTSFILIAKPSRQAFNLDLNLCAIRPLFRSPASSCPDPAIQPIGLPYFSPWASSIKNNTPAKKRRRWNNLFH